MIQLFRTNPGLLVWLLIFGIGALVCLAIGALMSRSGASLRSLYWFYGFLLLVGLPQFIAHWISAKSSLREQRPRVEALQGIAAADGDSARDALKRIFGPDVDPDLVIDARQRFGDALEKAEQARFASLPTGESVLLAQFRGYTDAEKAWVAYLRYTGLSQAGGEGDSQRGYVATRPAGDRAYALHMDNMLGVWTGPNDTAIRQRMAAGGFQIPRRAPLGAESAEVPSASSSMGSADTSDPARHKTNAVSKPRWNPVAIAAGLVVYLFIVVLYFFKGSSWAASSAPKTTTAPTSSAELMTRLEAINDLDVPFQLERGERPGEMIATWRYADAKWIDLARAHGMRRVHRIRLALDDASRVVRATDYAASFDWSAGRNGARIEWKAMTGITFFHYEHQRVFGLQLDEQGRFKPELSYAYTFNLQEMKSPLISAVTQAGWTWRPVAWQGPKWLRWLTE